MLIKVVKVKLDLLIYRSIMYTLVVIVPEQTRTVVVIILVIVTE